MCSTSAANRPATRILAISSAVLMVALIEIEYLARRIIRWVAGSRGPARASRGMILPLSDHGCQRSMALARREGCAAAGIQTARSQYLLRRRTGLWYKARRIVAAATTIYVSLRSGLSATAGLCGGHSPSLVVVCCVFFWLWFFFF